MRIGIGFIRSTVGQLLSQPSVVCGAQEGKLLDCAR